MHWAFESVANFVLELYLVAKYLSFDTSLDEMLCNRIVSCVQDKAIHWKLLDKNKLTRAAEMAMEVTACDTMNLK